MVRSVRWTVKVAKEADISVRSFLARMGMKKGDLSTFIEEAVHWRLFDTTVGETKMRNAGASAKDIDKVIEEALGADRAGRCKNDEDRAMRARQHAISSSNQ